MVGGLIGCAAKIRALKNTLLQMGSVMVAFSGGVDSSFLLKIAKDVLDGNVIAATSDSASIAREELEFATNFAKEIGVKHVIFSYQEVENKNYAANAGDRCYYCKVMLFARLTEYAQKNEIKFIVEGTNSDDIKGHRPGMLAARKYGVSSPLLEAGLTKKEIRQASKKSGLPTWNKPEAACLASRIAVGKAVTIEKLNIIEQAESFIKKLGVRNLRVRHHGQIARIEVYKEEFDKIISFSTQISEKLKSLGFRFVTMDIAGPSAPKK